MEEHKKYMQMALVEAQKAFDAGEVPIGAIVISKGKILAKAHNQTQLLNDVTAHAEIIAITSAANSIGAKYLIDCTLYVTLEPCAMCAGALAWSQITNIVYGASDEKKGFSRYSKNILHPKTKLISGVLEKECSDIIKDFFKSKRQ